MCPLHAAIIREESSDRDHLRGCSTMRLENIDAIGLATAPGFWAEQHAVSLRNQAQPWANLVAGAVTLMATVYMRQFPELTGQGRAQRKWVQPENVMFTQSRACSRNIRQNPAKSVKIRLNPAKSVKVRQNPLRLYPHKTH